MRRYFLDIAGIAPKAQWIACLVADADYFYEGPIKACGQWAVCPTKWDGSGRDCSKAPNVVSCKMLLYLMTKKISLPCTTDVSK